MSHVTIPLTSLCMPSCCSQTLAVLFDSVQVVCILCCRIDEIHMLVGGGSVRSGGLDISNLMKPALARGHLHCIGATTLDEHRKYFEKDSALERRFQPVMVNEPSDQEALVILEGLKVIAAPDLTMLCRCCMHACLVGA